MPFLTAVVGAPRVPVLAASVPVHPRQARPAPVPIRLVLSTESKFNSMAAVLRMCLVHFTKFCKDVKMAFEVLNEIYLQNFLHRWVVNREMNLMILINPCLINN